MKNLFNLRKKPKSLTVLLVTFLLSAFVGTLFVGKVSAAIPYTQYTGTLDGADWALRIPDPWNGMLVVFCRGFSATPVNPVSTLSFFSSSMLNAGFAVAASNYGVVGSATGIGQVTTYELTMYLIENYNVNGKIFLWGYSMGGAIALLLGEKYPDVYSGVLDLSGPKDLKAGWAQVDSWSKMSEAELTAELTAIGAPVPPFGYSSVQDFMDALATLNEGIELETGGTPATHPEAYEDLSAVYHADIQIPVITVHGTADPLVLYIFSLSYQNAVAKKGHSSLYRLYGVPGAEHIDANLYAEVPAHFDELVEWSNELTGSHDWPMYRNNVQHSGYSTSNAPTTNQTLWVTEFDNYLQSSPAVVNGKLYVGAFTDVVCLDAANGDILWNYTTGDFIFSTPAVVNGKVYIGSYDDVFYCLDADTGAKIWSYTTGGDILPSPAVVDGKVYVGSDDGKLYCFRADHGQVVWKFTAGDAVRSSPAVAYGKVYVGSHDHKFYCIDANSGSLEWSYTTGDEIPATAAVADGRVYIGSTDNTVYCLDADNGAKIWSYTTGDQAHNPAVFDGKVYVGSSDNNLYCLEAETGALIWSYTANGDMISPPAVADGKVYLGSVDRNIYCLDAETGAKIWSYRCGTTIMCYGAPAIANGVVYFASWDHNVYAFSAWEPIPEGLTIGVMLLLSTIAVAVSARYFNKRRKWENW